MEETCFGLVGEKLAHSFSPMIHESFDLGYSYNLFELEKNELTAFFETASFNGVNVTIPYKQDALQFCTVLSPIAKAIGNVNTIIKQPNGELFGDNTDGKGFFSMLLQSGILVENKKVLVLGSGGSSKTVCYMLKKLKAKEIVVISRNGKDNYLNIINHNNAQVIVNTTPVGMYPFTSQSPINLKIFPQLEGVLDLIYNPSKTKFLQDAKKLNIPNINGLTMLVAQAAEAAKLFCNNNELNINIKKVCNKLASETKNIVLIGMPGCGKSTIGELIAKKLNRKFIDTDIEIKKQTNKTITKIFELEGEEAFRKYEIDILQKYGKESSLVIATGGGCVTKEENYFSLNQNGIVIFIERDLNKLSTNNRPLSIKNNLQNMYNLRINKYKYFADATIKNDTTIEDTAQKVEDAFNEAINN